MFVIASNAIKPEVCTFMCIVEVMKSAQRFSRRDVTSHHIHSWLKHFILCHWGMLFFFARRVFQIFFGLTFLQWIYFTPKNAFILSSTLNVYIIVYFPSKLAFFFGLSVWWFGHQTQQYVRLVHLLRVFININVNCDVVWFGLVWRGVNIVEAKNLFLTL